MTEKIVPLHQTWPAMENLVLERKWVRRIGLSNYNCQMIRDLMGYCVVKPEVGTTTAR